MRRSTLIAMVCTAVLLVAASGCGGDSGSSSTGTTVAADVTVHASDLKFDAKSYTATSHGGDVTVQLVNDSSATHSLLIDGKSGFRLQVTGRGDSDSKSVALAPGTYTIYCDVPGHRQAGMEATLTVS